MAVITLSSSNQEFQFMILSFSGLRKVDVASKWLSLSCYFWLWFVYGRIKKKKIRVYKDLKFRLLRLIYDYKGFNVKWLILRMLLEIRIYELICLNWFLWVKKFISTLLENLDGMVLRMKMMKFHFGHWFMKNYSLVPKLWKNYNLTPKCILRLWTVLLWG